jgi:CRP-like cAMP-binding protein
MKKGNDIKIEGLEEIEGADLIQDTFLFKGLNFSEAQGLAKICQLEKFAKAEVIIEENALGQALYLVHKGEVRVVKGEGAQAKEIARLGRGQLFGEMSLIDDALTSAAVIAAGELELFVIHRDRFEKLLDSDPRLALKIYKSFCRTLSERLRKTTLELSKKPCTAPAKAPKKKPKGR